MDKKLDLSRLSEEEAKHVWEVIQRDFELRKKEEERLGDLRTKIEKEESKTELLVSQSNLADSHCIRCLQAFKFLVNSKRQCLDCKLFTCKSCSRYNKKERGWVCDPCRMTRVLKIGTLGWYHDNVRSRFKRFGSAKVMRSLYKRLNEEGDTRHDDDTQSMPDFHHAHNGHDDEQMDAAEIQRYKQMRKTKRLLSVHPLDLDLDRDIDYATHSRRQSVQYLPEERGVLRYDLEYTTDMYHQQNQRMNRRKSLDRFSRPDEGLYSENRMVRARSLSRINSAMTPRQHYLDTSEEEDIIRYPVYQLPPRRRSRASSQENVNQGAPPINELSKRMSAIESLLNRLEEKITLPAERVQSTTAPLEEQKLRKKLDELMSDRALSSDDDEPRRLTRSKGFAAAMDKASVAPALQEPLSSSSDEMTTEAQKRSTAAALCDITTEILRTINATESAMSELAVSDPIDRLQLAGTDVKQTDDAYRELEENVYMTAGKSFDIVKKLQKVEKKVTNNYSGGPTDSDLSELEDKVALAVAKVQSTESEVSDIETKIAALNAKGLSTDKARKKTNSFQQKKKTSQDISSNRLHF